MAFVEPEISISFSFKFISFRVTDEPILLKICIFIFPLPTTAPPWIAGINMRQIRTPIFSCSIQQSYYIKMCSREPTITANESLYMLTFAWDPRRICDIVAPWGPINFLTSSLVRCKRMQRHSKSVVFYRLRRCIHTSESRCKRTTFVFQKKPSVKLSDLSQISRVNFLFSMLELVLNKLISSTACKNILFNVIKLVLKQFVLADSSIT